MTRTPFTLRISFQVFLSAFSVLGAGPAVADGAQSTTPVFFNLAADGVCGQVPFSKPLAESSLPRMIREGYRKLIDRYASARITHLLLNVNYQRACYPSKVWESYWDLENPESRVTGWPRQMWLIFKAGVDPYARCIEYCRLRGISPWISMRMNDTHYVDDPDKAGTFWRKHPEYRSSPRGGFDFALPEVRAYHLALIKEILDRYDADGLELDWMRFCHHFKPSEAAEKSPVLTEFMRAVKRVALEAQKRRGRRVRIAARVPAVPEFARGLGMDAVAWVREGLLDVLIVSSTWMPADRDTPLEKWRHLIGPVRHNYLLLPSMGLWVQCVPGGVHMPNDLESARGFTVNAFDRGADGIYLFNHFNLKDFRYRVLLPDGKNEERDIFRELVSEATRFTTALGKPRRHILTFHDTAPPGVQNPKPLPVVLRPGRWTALNIHTGPKPTSGRVFLRIGLADRPGVWEAELAARVNGIECRPAGDLNRPGQYRPFKGKGWHAVRTICQVAPRLARMEVPRRALKRGENLVELALQRGEEQTVTWFEVRIAGE